MNNANPLIAKAEQVIGYFFKNKNFLSQAFVHRSFINENRNKQLVSNERLEFLGDAVLELVISSFLYEHFPNLSEGQLTKLRAWVVCEDSISAVSKSLNLSSFLSMGKGELLSGGLMKNSILGDLFEAVIGAIYLDGGLDSAKEFILRCLQQDAEAKAKDLWLSDCKSHLQEYTQKARNSAPVYTTIEELGPPHQRIYRVEVSVNGQKVGFGEGNSKKEAEQCAAGQAIKFLKI